MQANVRLEHELLAVEADHTRVLIQSTDLHPEHRLVGRIEEVFEFWTDDRSHPDARGFESLIDVLAHDVLIRHPLRAELDEVEQEIIKLSKRQFTVLDILAGNRRVAVSGPAGSGKTLIAAEKARRLAGQGLRVLFACFNRPLADHLRASMAEASGVDVYGFHQLCTELAAEATIPPGDRKEQRFWDLTLPKALEQAADSLGPRYDAIVADEAQDFDELWWLPLLTLLHDPDHGIFYVFYDDNQAIYRAPGGLPDGLPTARLVEDLEEHQPDLRRGDAVLSG